MQKLTTYIHQKLSVRLSIWIVSFVAVLLIVAVLIMFFFSRQAIKDEALDRAEKTLDTAILSIGNILHEAETAATNMQWNVEHHLHEPQLLATYCQEMIRHNQMIDGCTVAFKDERGMIYYHRNKEKLVFADSFGDTPYRDQEWFTRPIEENDPTWSDPITNQSTYNHPVISYSIPIRDTSYKTVGVFAVDISLNWLSNFIFDTQFLPKYSIAMISQSGAFLIHPDSTLLRPGALFEQIKTGIDKDMSRVANAMLKGESGCISSHFYGAPCYILYKPFKDDGWSIDLIYFEDQIFAEYHILQYQMLWMMIGGIILLFLICIILIQRLIKPMLKLDSSVQRLTEGHFDETIPMSRRTDEVGHLQRAFHSMQVSLVKYLSEINQRHKELNERNMELQQAHDHAQEADRIKSSFLQNMTDQMVKPANSIHSIVNTIRREHKHLEKEEIARMTQEIQDHTMTITSLLSQVLDIAEKKK